MGKPVNVFIKASMPVEVLREFLQNLRDFDMKHDSKIPFEAILNGGDLTEDEIVSIYKSIKPPMPYMGSWDIEGRLRWADEEKPS